MITTISPLRRAAVTLMLTGATALGAVAVAPAAFADDTTTVTEQAPVTEVAPDAPVAPEVVVPETPAPVVEQAPAPAPVVVTPPEVVIGKDGKPVKAPKVCTAKDLSDYAAKLAKANAQAAPLLKAAELLRQGAAALRAQVPTMNHGQGKKALALAEAAELAASKLEAQAQAIVAKVGGVGCIEVTAPGARF
jgi:hypothetical protein